jgi:hypothetical protein
MLESVVVITVFAVCTAGVVIRRRRRDRKQPPPLGIVLLLSQAKPLRASTLAELFGRVTETTFQVVASQGGRRVTPADLPKGNAVLGDPPSFLVQAAGDLFVVNSVAKPYATDLQYTSEGVDATLVGKAREEHLAWLSVEILHPEAASAANYRIVAQVIAELLSVDCLALFHPESRKLVPADASEMLAKLRAPHPITAVFGVAPGVL